MKSIANLIFEMTDMYPSIRGISNETLVSRIKSVQEELYQFLGKETPIDKTVTVNNQAVHIASDFRSDNLIRVLYYEQGVGMGSTNPNSLYTEVENIDDLKIKEFPDYLKLPLQNANYNVATVIYRAVPQEISSDPSTWDTTYPVIDEEYTDLIIYMTIKAISMYGDIPDISINNAYERMAREKYSKAKADYWKRKAKNKVAKHAHNKYW